MSKPRFFYKTIYLDNLFSRRIQDGNHWIGSTFKAFRVESYSDENFELTLVPDPDNGSVEGMVLDKQSWHNFATIPNRGVFENSTAQPGKWVRLLLTTEDPLTSGKVETLVNSRSIKWEGSTSPQSKVTIDSSVDEILDADDNRIIARFQYKSGTGTVYVGSTDELNDPDFANICHQVDPEDDFEIDGTGAHSAKCVGGTNVYSLRKGIN